MGKKAWEIIHAYCTMKKTERIDDLELIMFTPAWFDANRLA